MSLYVTYSTRIYEIYLKYIAPEDIHVYSIDEVMMDATDYLATYRMTAEELARKMILDVQETVGITGDRWNRNQSVSVQGGYGHCIQTHSAG